MIKVQSEPLDLHVELAEFNRTSGDAGAIVTFSGIVRAYDNDRPLRSLTLEHYPGMTEAMLQDIDAQAQARWPISQSLVIHRYGRMVPGETIVFVATASRHRRAAFEAAEFLMDWLKTDAPFWKLEELEDGCEHWVEAKNSDDDARKRWLTDNHPASG